MRPNNEKLNHRMENKLKVNTKDMFIKEGTTVIDAMKQLTKLGSKKQNNILLVVDNGKSLVGTLSDGDIRRAFLAGLTREALVEDICKKTPIIAPEFLSSEGIKQLMVLNRIHNIPVVNKDKTVLYVEYLEGLDLTSKMELVAVVMAGGEGTRLRPLTNDIPKPMLEVGNKPILQIILESLRKAGFKRILLNVRHLSHIIKSYFKDGSEFDLNIEYIEEPKPMGTAGSLGIIPTELIPSGPFIVVNGDLLTTLNFRAFYDFHIAANYDFTLCGRPYEVEVPFGYPVIDGDVVTAFREKPIFTHLVNSGIYCISNELIDEVPKNEYFDMPDLIRRTIELGKRVGVFPLREEFHEIGRPESYRTAEEFYRTHFMQNGECK